MKANGNKTRQTQSQNFGGKKGRPNSELNSKTNQTQNPFRNPDDMKVFTEGKTKDERTVKIMHYFTSENYPKPLVKKSLQNGLNKAEFISLFEFLVRKILNDDSFKVDSDDQIVQLLQDFSYPGKIQKTALQNVGAPNTWQSMLTLLDWLTDIASFTNEFKEYVDRDLRETWGTSNFNFDSLDGLSIEQSEDKISKAFCVCETEEQKQAFISGLQNKNMSVISETNGLQAQITAELTETNNIRNNCPNLDTLQRTLENKQNKFNQKGSEIESLRKEIQVTSDTVREKNDALTELDTNLKEAEKEKRELDEKVKAQGLTKEEATSLMKGTEILNDGIKDLSQKNQEASVKLIKVKNDIINIKNEMLKKHYMKMNEPNFIDLGIKNAFDVNQIQNVDVSSLKDGIYKIMEELQKNIKSNQEIVRAKEDELSKLRKDQKEIEGTITQYQTSNTKMETTIGELSRTLEDKIEERKNDSINFEETKKRMLTEIENLNYEIERLKFNLEGLKEKLISLTEQNDLRERKINAFEAEMKRLYDEAVNLLQTEIKKHEKLLDERMKRRRNPPGPGPNEQH
ncbi:MAG: hypothetical protein MJ252_08000 [archaeon]|nr:hypothetical protein [archaeon]